MPRNVVNDKDGGTFEDRIFRAEITVDHIEPVPRRVLFLPDMSLGELHEVMRAIFQWECCHLREFLGCVQRGMGIRLPDGGR